MHNPENPGQSSSRPERPSLFEHSPSRAERPSVSSESAKGPGPILGARSSDKPSSKVKWDVISPRSPVIKVIGVGGGGCNAVQSMVEEGFDGVEFYAINTDYQSLQRCTVPNRIQIGEKLTHGSGTGAIPSIGEQAARDAEDQIREILAGADMIFTTAGMGGGTGTGAAPVIAEIARSMDILNVAIVTKPFHFEGSQRMRRAIEGIRKLGEHVDTMITILNDKLMEAVGPKTPLTEAFDVANSVLGQGIRAISDLIAMPGLINVDFRDLRTIMGETGGAVMGVGVGKGENRAVEAVRKACHSPLQEKIVIDGARGVLINITGPPTVTMHEINEATSMVYEAADPEANIIFGVVIDDKLQDAMRVTIIATGFGTEGSDGAASGHDEKLRPRLNKYSSGNGNGNGGHSLLSGSLADSDLVSLKPSILQKREREGSAPPPSPKVDFTAPENPILNWGKSPASASVSSDQGSKEADESTSELFGKPKAAVLNEPETEPQTQASASEEDPYEIPALHRRRRQRFFE
ncbi:cell division protein FtsZ [Candidatus Sumerlaeota bacterium]|nr:cell division protein FtsZ [Candidatus Sumerlaeota bacterium]